MKKAYNLSEILTAFMLTGIVAAMTIPTLYNISITQKNRTTLKKTFSSYTINIQQLLASTGTICQSLSCTRHWSKQMKTVDGIEMPNTTHNGALAQTSNFNYEECYGCVNKDDINLPSEIKGKDFTTYRLPNLSYAMVYDYAEGNCNKNIGETNDFKACSILVLDVNGKKTPNMPCKDRYAFYVANEAYSKNVSVGARNYNLIETYLVPFGYNDIPAFGKAPYNCTAQMMYNNWKQ